MSKSAKDALTAVLALGVTAAALYFGFVGRAPKVALDTYQVLGAVTAEETARLLGGKGAVLALARGTGDAENPSVEAELKAFRETVRKATTLTVRVEKVEGSPMEMMATGGGIGADELFKRLQSHPGLAGVVLFMGFPSLNSAELEALRKHQLKIVLAAAFQPGVDRLLEQGAVQLAIVPKPDSPPDGAPPPKNLRERFDREYLILTPDRHNAP